jgi:hypothetical protein
MTDVLQLFSTTKTLETTSMKASTTITGEENIAHLVPDIGIDAIINSALFKENMVLHLEATVSAGYKLEKLTTGNITAEKNGAVTLTLPLPEILNVTITKTLKAPDAAIMTQKDKDLQEALTQKAQELMLQDALNSGIINMAITNTEKSFKALLDKANISLDKVTVK